MSQLQVTGEAKIRDIQGPVVANDGVVTALDGAASQYVRGDGTLADFPTSSGGGSSVSYYLNSSVSQGTIGGVAYRELSKDPIIGTGTDIAISSNGYVANYITDVNDPDVTIVAGGNFNCEFYFSVSNDTGNPFTYAELYKYDGITFTLLGSSVAVPEYINQGTIIAPYYFAIPVPSSALALTDRLAIRIYVNVDGRTVTLHTENGHLCQVVTTLSKGMVSLNNLTDQSQFLTTGTAGTNFAIASTGDTHTFNLPVASATNTGKLSSTDWSTFNGKVPYTGAISSVDLGLYEISAQNAFLNGVSGVNGGNLFLRQDIDFGQSTGYTTLYSSGKNLGFVSYVGSYTYNALFSLNSLTNNSTRTFTLPDLSGTLALLEGSQTFSGAKTFSLDITVNGINVGKGAGSGLTYNTRVGALNFMSNTTGAYNSSFGYESLNANTTGLSNTAIGFSSLSINTTGNYNTAIGSATMQLNITGSNNTAVGYGALGYNLGSNNIAVGSTALVNNTTGSNNTAIGPQAGSQITTGSNNTLVGGFIGGPTISNNIILSDGAGNIRYRWDGTNNVFTGATTFGSSVSINTGGQASLSILSSSGNSALILGYVNSVLKGTIDISATEFKLISAIDNILKFQSSTNFRASLIFSSTADYSYTFPASTGTIALTSQLPTYGNLTSADTSQLIVTGGTGAVIGAGANITLLNASATNGGIVSTGAQTFAGAKTFSSSVTAQLIQINSTGSAIGSGNELRFYRPDNVVYTQLYDGGNPSGFILDNRNGNGFDFQAIGNSQLKITSGGNVGIGTATPTNLAASYRSLCVNGSSAGFFETRVGDVSSGRYISDSNGTGIGDVRSGKYLYLYTEDTERMRITSGGQLFVGFTSGTNGTINSVTSSGRFALTLYDEVENNSLVSFRNSSLTQVGSITITGGTSTAYNTTSDYRLKQDFKDYNGLDLVSAIKTYNYEWKSNKSRMYGVVAHELQEVIPYAVTGEKDAEEMQSVDYSKLVPILVKAIQELKAEIEILKNK